jgi:hypothetical protein
MYHITQLQSKYKANRHILYILKESFGLMRFNDRKIEAKL